jgi:hypothetical protein
MLMMACCTRTFSRCGIFASQKMQKVSGLQFRSAIGLAGFINQQREGDARFFTEQPSVIAVAESNRGKRGTLVPERLLMFAQLRDVLAAKDSSVVAEKNQHGRLSVP